MARANQKIRAYHFTGDKLRDERPIPKPGEVLTHSGDIEICSTGLHGSRKPLDALRYAPGHHVHYVEMWGDVYEQSDKLVARNRKILWSLDAEPTLRRFACRCALDVLHLWDAPDIVVQYLKTGNESTRAAAGDAAGDAAWAAARDAARVKQNLRLVAMLHAAHKEGGERDD